MDFGFSDDQEQLQRTVRDYLAAKAPVAYARQLSESDDSITTEVWDEIASMGWLGLAVPEQFGGIGLGILDLSIVMEALGEVVFPGPFMSTTCLAIPALLQAAMDEEKEELLPGIVAGTRRCTLAVAEENASWRAEGLVTGVVERDGGYLLNTTKLFVPDLVGSDTILVALRHGAGVGLFRVDPAAEGVTVQAMETVDRTRALGRLVCENVELNSDALLGRAALSDQHFDQLIDLASTMLSAEMCGAAARSLDMTVEYLGLREQFGRAIATFQALQHRAADMKVAVENVRSLTYYGAWSFDDAGQDARLPAAMLKAYASDACTKVVADAVQLHGGIGFTWEHDLQLYFKRLKADEVMFGDAIEQRERVAQLLDL